MTLRILVVAPQPFFTLRGTPIAVRNLLTTLGDAGHLCDVLVFPEGDDIVMDNVTLIRAPKVPGTGRMPPGFSVKKVGADLALFFAMVWRLVRYRYDLVIAVEEAAFMAMALKPVFGVPYIYDVDSSIPEQIDEKFGLPPLLLKLARLIEGMAVRRSVGAIPCCAALADIVKDYAPELPVQTLEDISLVEHDTETTVPEDWTFSDPVILYVGNLERYQGVDLLIEGVARVRETGLRAELVVIGGTPEHIAAHQALAIRLGVGGSAHFLGPRAPQEIGHYMAQAAVVASPRRQGRNTPMKIYTYLDSGRPLLATRLPTHTQVLDDEISMLVDPTPEDMSRGIARLLSDTELAGRLSGQAAERVRTHYSPSAYRRKLGTFIDVQITPRLKMTPASETS